MSDMTQDRTHDVTIRCRHGEGTDVFGTVREQPGDHIADDPSIE